MVNIDDLAIYKYYAFNAQLFFLILLFLSTLSVFFYLLSIPSNGSSGYVHPQLPDTSESIP
jgi:hypothetical protein